MAKLHLIGNAHLDPVWLWRWQEGYSEVLATYRSALDRMNDFPDYKFTSACAVYYQWIEKTDKSMFEEIKQRVKEGRWNIVGGWFLQPDCNIPSGESFARHGLISQRYFKEKFGVTAKTGYNVDSFGHNGNLPQILKKSGMDNYVFMRPGPHEKNLEHDVFLWESADGSRVGAYRIPVAYSLGSWGGYEFFGETKEKADKLDLDYMIFYGVGNHGGGPTIKIIDHINHMEIPDMIYSTPDEYFAAIDKDRLPVVADDLQHHAPGCYSACTFIKTNNRKCENNLIAAEKFASMAKHLVGAEYPKEKLNQAWENVLFNQFHDIMGGCSIKQAYEDAGYLYGETMSITEKAINFALQSISHKVDTLGNETLPTYQGDWQKWTHEVLGMPVVVFNPHAWTVKMPVEIHGVAKKVTDDKGNEIPFQAVRGPHSNWETQKIHTTFMAEVGALGYAVYRVFTEQISEVEFEKELSCVDNVLENSRIRVEFSKLTGDICRFYDKQSEKYIIDRECKAILLDETAADTWAHEKTYLGDMVGMFDTPEFLVVEDGPVCTTLRVTTRYNNSVLSRDYTITPGCDVVKVKTKVDFHEKHRTLKFAFPIETEEVIAKIPYGTISRKTGLGEEPGGSWFAAGGVCVANDSKYGYDTTADDMRLTILRSCIWADHGCVKDESIEYMEQGIHEFTYSVFPYKDNCDAEKNAEELNFALRAVRDSFHKGPLPERLSCMSCEGNNIVVTAVKQAEDGDEQVVRFCEMNGAEENVSITLFDKKIETKVAHNEIKTFKMNGTEVNLIEW